MIIRVWFYSNRNEQLMRKNKTKIILVVYWTNYQISFRFERVIKLFPLVIIGNLYIFKWIFFNCTNCGQFKKFNGFNCPWYELIAINNQQICSHFDSVRMIVFKNTLTWLLVQIENKNKLMQKMCVHSTLLKCIRKTKAIAYILNIFYSSIWKICSSLYCPFDRYITDIIVQDDCLTWVSKGFAFVKANRNFNS